MQLVVVMTEEGRLSCPEFGADPHLIEGSGLKHGRGEDTHLHQRLAGAGAEVLKGPNPSLRSARPWRRSWDETGGLDY